MFISYGVQRWLCWLTVASIVVVTGHAVMHVIHIHLQHCDVGHINDADITLATLTVSCGVVTWGFQVTNHVSPWDCGDVTRGSPGLE